MLRLRTIGLFSLSLPLSVFAAAQEMHPPARSTPAFDQLKSLAGEWEGTNTQGSKVHLTYQVVSNGSVLMERLQSAGESEMITMYSLDGDHIVVTHYCSAGNQPTMQTPTATAATGKYDFSFVRVSGMKTPDEGHMVSLSVSMPDKDHLTQVWTFDDHGKSLVDTFTYTRKK
jgi:Tfp pilus assembly protein PilW